MVGEKQKYVLVISRNIGFALTVPLSSIVFQWIVFKKSLLSGYLIPAVILFTLAWLFIGVGFFVLMEKK